MTFDELAHGYTRCENCGIPRPEITGQLCTSCRRKLHEREVDELNVEIDRYEALNEKLHAALAEHTAKIEWLRVKMGLVPNRVWKLIEKHKFFLVVSESEPYFETVYRMIRQTEIDQGTWTDEDEVVFQDHTS